MKSLRNMLGQAMWITLVAVWGTAPVGAAVDGSDYWYCHTVEDFLDCRPYYANTSLEFEPRYLQWGKERGIPELQGEILPEKRHAALELVYRRCYRPNYLPPDCSF